MEVFFKIKATRKIADLPGGLFQKKQPKNGGVVQGKMISNQAYRASLAEKRNKFKLTCHRRLPQTASLIWFYRFERLHMGKC